MTTRVLRRPDSRQRLLSLALAAVFGSGAVFSAVASTQLFLLLGDGVMPGPGVPSLPPIEQPTPTSSPTATPTPRPTATPVRTPVVTPTPSPSPSPVVTPTPSPPPTPRPTVQPTTPPGGGVLPDCRYDDLLTARHAYVDWATTLLDTIYRLPADYYPGDLVDVSAAGLTGAYRVRSLVIADLRALSDAARAAGVPIAVISGFRSYEQQQATFNHWASVVGYEQALRVSARPGHSEHQLGTALDFSTPGGAAPWEYADWATTPTGAWLAANAWRYGFVMTYPAGRSAVTCYDYEPWHYRYVGRDVAAAVTASGLTPREFFWQLAQ